MLTIHVWPKRLKEFLLTHPLYKSGDLPPSSRVTTASSPSSCMRKVPHRILKMGYLRKIADFPTKNHNAIGVSPQFAHSLSNNAFVAAAREHAALSTPQTPSGAQLFCHEDKREA